MIDLHNNVVLAVLSVCVAVIAVSVVPTQTFSASSDSVNVSLTVGTTSTTTDDDKQGDTTDQQQDDDNRPGQTASLLIDIANITKGQNYLQIVWETTVQAKSSVRWSRADNGGVSEVQASQDYGRTHTTKITGLRPGTRYQIELTAEAQNGDTKTRRQIVRTDLPGAPKSVRDFTATLTADNAVRLSWNPPADDSYEYVRVTRRTEFFTDNPLRGRVVHEGTRARVQDASVQAGQTYFYSVFTRGSNGQWSAPSLAAIYVPATDKPLQDETIDEIVDQRPQAPPETRRLLNDLSFADLIFSQSNRVVSNNGDAITLSANQNFSIGLDYDKLPEVLKTIVVTISRPNMPDKSFSFLLRADEKQNFYTATVGALQKAGSYQITVTVLDYKYRRVKTLRGQIHTIQTADQPATSTTPTVVNQLNNLRPETNADGFLWLLLILFTVGAAIIKLEHWLGGSRKAHG